MISSGEFYKILSANGINFFTGVPDSLLKDFCSYISDNIPEDRHIINSNEGSAVALASGHYLATGKPSLVYMQNSGLGNSVNPLLSLADNEVYGIPMLLLIGWRGEPGKKDEPQHIKQGRVLTGMLEAMEIPFEKINGMTVRIDELVENVCRKIINSNQPHALLVSSGTFSEYISNFSLKSEESNKYPLQREEAVKIILNNLTDDEIIVSTTGMISREVFEYRKNNNQGHEKDFLTVGSMGHCSQIALGISLIKKDRQVFILDGDGAVIMHMGSLAVTADKGGENFKHIILNNGAHDSVGGQPTLAFKINLSKIAESCGYRQVITAQTSEEIKEKILELKKCKGPSLLEIKISKGFTNIPGRPDISPADNKKNFIKYLS